MSLPHFRAALVVVACLCSSLPSSASELSQEIERWFTRYASRKDDVRLYQPEDLHYLIQHCAQNPDWKQQAEDLQKEFERQLKRTEDELALAGPGGIIERLRACDGLKSYRGADAFERYIAMLELFDRVARDGDDESLRSMLDIASFDRDRSYSPKDWRKVFEFRPRIVQREARLALLRADATQVTGVLLSSLDDGARPKKKLDAERAISRRIVALEVLAALTRRTEVAEDLARSVVDRCFMLLTDVDEPDACRAVAARSLRSILDGRTDSALDEARLDRLLVAVETEVDKLTPAILDAYLGVIERQTKESSIERLARLLADRSDLNPRAHRSIWETLNGLAPIHLKDDGDNRAWLEWYEKERGQQRFQDWFAVIDRAKRTKERSAYEPPRFYGVPIVGHRVAFVIDVSGSMLFPLEEGGKDPKIDQAKAQLGDAIAKLEDYDSLHLVTFGADVRSFKDAMTEVGPVRKKALGYVEKLRPGGGTNLFGGLLAGFGLRKLGELPPEDVDFPDQLIVLSDGNPTLGDLLDPGDIREEVARLNAARRTRIDTIALGTDADEEFLAGLAAEHGGETVVIKKPADWSGE